MSENEKEAVFRQTSQWANVADGVYLASQESTKIIDPGVYKYQKYGPQKAFVRASIKTDELILLPESVSTSVLGKMDVFLVKESEYKNRGFLHRRGFLFHGPPGTGKTSLIHQIMHKVVSRGGIVLLCDYPDEVAAALVELRSIEPNRLIVCLFEDLEEIIDNYGDRALLSLLSGESQVDKVINIATTNFINKLDSRIVGRPGRFDEVIEIGFPDKAIRRHYFKNKLKIEDAELDTWVEATEKFSFAACTELVISVKCLDKPFKEAIKDIKELTKKREKEEKEDRY